jgi:ATP-binding cassette subfamily F protein 3
MILGRIDSDAGSIFFPRNYRIGHVEQYINFTQVTALEEGCLGLRDEEKHNHWKVEKVLSGLGFNKDDLSKHPSVFSGGYQIRLNLAKVLISFPDLLLLDEPNNYLVVIPSKKFPEILPSYIIRLHKKKKFMRKPVFVTIKSERKRNCLSGGSGLKHGWGGWFSPG